MKASSLCLCLSLSLVYFSAAPVIPQGQNSETPTYRSGLKSIAMVTVTASPTSAPGTRNRNVNATVPPTAVLPSNATRLRSNSNRDKIPDRAVADTGDPWKAC